MGFLPFSSVKEEQDSESSYSLLEGHVASESHSDSADIIRDIIIGFADGLTVPFALTAGLSSLGSSKLVITGGLAELFSGAISMGLGAYLAAVTERDRYLSEEEREKKKVATKPEAKVQQIYDVFAQYGISKDASKAVVGDLIKDDDNWVRVSSEYNLAVVCIADSTIQKFLMDFELKIEKPNVSRAWISAGTMGLSYFIGVCPLAFVITHKPLMVLCRWPSTYDTLLYHQ